MTGFLLALAVAGAGGMGAASRLIVDGFVKSRVTIPFPVSYTHLTLPTN